MQHPLIPPSVRLFPTVMVTAILFATAASAQDRLKTMPGYQQFERMRQAATNAFKSGAVSVTWKDEGKAFEFTRDGKRFRYDVATLQKSEAGKGSNQNATLPREGRRQRNADSPARGRQFTSVISPDGKHKAFYKDFNLWLSDASGSNAVRITTNGSAAARLKFGSADWAYGEELYQITAMWWSSNSQKIAFYRFDESRVPDYYLALNQVRRQNTLYTEPYPKAGGTNPVVGILIYDLGTKQVVEVDVRDGKAFDDDVVGHYVYNVSWTHDSREMLFHRTDRRQKIMELCAANPETGKCRVVVREEWPASWTENLPTMRFLAGGKRFIWSSERTGWKNYYLYDLSGRLVTALTKHSFEVDGISRVDEPHGWLFYLARDGDNPHKTQLHRVNLDGTDDRRLTDPAFHHIVDVAPDGAHFIDIAQTHDQPPGTSLRDSEGKLLDQLATSDLTRFKQAHMRPVELFEFKAADGKTDLYGLLHRPTTFSRWTKYPLLVSVYAGPDTTGAHETFSLPNPITEFGFLLASFDARSAGGRGKRSLDSIYTRFGQPEIDDQAAGVRFLTQRWNVSENRVGIFGTSYGGTASAMCLLRYPKVFHAAAASSGVMDWHNYDTIYTERYMGLPRENAHAYTAGSVVSYVTNLTGRLMIFYGTADDNVHPANSLQLIAALQRARKSFDVQVGPDIEHASMNRDRMMEFFIDVLRR